jgi:hypothetical protein
MTQSGVVSEDFETIVLNDDFDDEPVRVFVPIQPNIYNQRAFSLKAIPTPLQKIVGLYEAEEYYDALDLPSQLIIDLLASGWQQDEIALFFGVNKSWVTVKMRQIRLVLAETKLRDKLQLRQDLKTVMRGENV